MKLLKGLGLILVLSFAVCATAEETDPETVVSDEADEGEEGEAMSSDTFNEQERQAITDSQETHEFQAQVNRLMDIIINSLYSSREIFLRELISNAADALDKIRFKSLSDSAALGEGDAAELDIKITFDKDAKSITITDKGVGMTKEDLVNNLGVVAKSGTTEFLEAAASGESDTLSLIGQFGVGFYSVYLVADKVTVVSKNNDDDQYVWESTANSVFTVAKDPRGNTLGRGTSVTLHLKEDAEEFLSESELEKIVTRYSQFINFPIYLHTTKTVSKEVPIEEGEGEQEEAAETDSDEAAEEGDEELEVSDDEEEEEKPKTKTVKEEVSEWKRLNKAKAIWTRDPKDVTEEEYNEFYETLTGLTDTPLDKIHFVAEGEITFKALMYIPSKAPAGQYSDLFKMKTSGVKLYVRRVLISDEFEDFLPRYMNFVRGVVDSDDLPLNVSRETLAQSRVLKVMSKKLVRKVLDTLRKMAQKSEKSEDDEEEGEEAEAAEGDEPVEEEEDDQYMKFWEEHGKSIKFGVIDDRKNKAKLTKLLRYQTSKSDEKFISLETYVERMKDDQKHIYYATGESLEKVKNSPFLEKVIAKGYEVVYMTEPIDEYVVQGLTEFDGVELQSVSKEGLKIGKEDKERMKELKEEFKPLMDWAKELYGDTVTKVAISNRLGTSPCIIVTGQYGWSANMQRIVKGATLQSKQNSFMQAKKTLEINPRHPMIVALKAKVEENPEDDTVKDLARMLLDSALLQSGFPIEDYGSFNTRMDRVLKAGLNLDVDAKVEEEPEDPEEPEESEDDEEEEEVEEAEDEPAEEAAEEAAPEHSEL